jgi:hypothetical protein
VTCPSDERCSNIKGYMGIRLRGSALATGVTDKLELAINLGRIHDSPLVAVEFGQLAIDNSHFVDRLGLEAAVRADVR